MENLPIILCAAVSTIGYMIYKQTQQEVVCSELTDENFKEKIAEAKKEGKLLFCKLYAPWCGFCKQLAPIWDELEKAVAEDPLVRKGVNVVKINADAEEKARNFFKVESFPTIVLYDGKNDKYFKYGKKEDEQRTVESFLKYIKKQLK